ncbi:MAG: hypothetical protein L0154_22710 [Chloroflexi bacterium]|nr:hypothetical protein [Chloroflexota bacterium]
MDHNSLQIPVQHLREGFNNGDVEQIVNCFGSSITMLSGNFSGDPLQWEAHEFLAGDAIRPWAEMMVTRAGPQVITQQEILHVHERVNGGLVVTRESGSNRFRDWQDELTAYWLGNIDGEWKIMGFFIRDIRNPG